MGGPGGKKFSPCHFYDSTLLILSGILGHMRTFERKLGHLRTWRPFFCSLLDLEWKLKHLRGREGLFCFLPDLEWKLGHVRSWRPFLFYSTNQCGPRLQNFLQCGPSCEKFAHPWTMRFQPSFCALHVEKWFYSAFTWEWKPESWKKKSKQLWLFALLAFCPSLRAAWVCTLKVLVRIKFTLN